MHKKEHLIIALDSTLEEIIKTETNLNAVNYANFYKLYQAVKESLHGFHPDKNKNEYSSLISSLPEFNHKKWNWMYDSPKALIIFTLITLPFIIALLTTTPPLISLLTLSFYILLLSSVAYSFYKTHLTKKQILKDLATLKTIGNDIIFSLKHSEEFKIEMEKLEIKKKMHLSSIKSKQQH